MTSWSLFACLRALTAAYAIGIAIYPLLRRGGRVSMVTRWSAPPAIVALLFVVPGEEVVLRSLTAFPLTDLVLRVFDFSRQCRNGPAANCTWSRYCVFLSPFPLFLVTFGLKDRRLDRRDSRRLEFTRIVLGGTVFGLGWPCLFLAQQCPALRSSFLLDHAVKLVLFVIVVESTSQSLWGLERLLGYDTPLPMKYTFLSRTPAEFWTRWNQRVYGWLYINVFLPSGGNRAPVRGIVATFLVSAILHEVMFDIATSRVDGYQAAFFLIQIPAVLVSRPLERLARTGSAVGVTLAHVVTILWMASSSVFFFHGVNRIFPFYYAAGPWLP